MFALLSSLFKLLFIFLFLNRLPEFLNDPVLLFNLFKYLSTDFTHTLCQSLVFDLHILTLISQMPELIAFDAL